MRKILFTFILIGTLLTPVIAEENVSNNNMTEPLQNSTQIPYKEPISKRKIAMKFIYAMGGVVASSMILFVGLSIYNKIRSKVIKVANNDYSNTLNTPNNLKDAVNIYLEKTRN